MARLFFIIVDERPPDVTIRRWREFTRDAMAEVGALYENDYKMRHFEDGARTRYGYQSRTEGHIRRKARLVAQRSFKVSPDANLDLIFTGALRKAIKVRHLIRAFPSRVTVNMPSPSYAQMKPKQPSMPNLGDEVTRVASDEQLEMERAHRDSLEHDLNTYREAKVKQIG